MQFLLANWRWVLLATLIASNAITFKLWRGAVEDLAVFKAQVDVIGEQAKKDNDRIEKEHAKVNKEIKDAIPKQIATARSNAVRAYASSLPAHPGSGGVSGTSILSGGTDEPSKEPVVTCRPGFIEDAAQDAATIGLVQDWVRKVGLPVK